ncbi:MAG TPA: DUF3352 domain-containing protein [Actinomycetota bacterium]|nr:DUF3352 domain-containing protein [Actinomycetota bacterium]
MVKAKVVGIVVAVAMVAGVAAWAIVDGFMGPSNDSAVEIAPADSFVYANVWLNPSRNQKSAIRDLLEKFDKAPTTDEAKGALVDFIDGALSETGATFEEDIEPWLGRQAAFYASDVEAAQPTLAALIATEDRNATQEMIDEFDERENNETEPKSYKGVDYNYYADDQVASGFIGDFWVFGTESGFRASVDASEGESLAGNARYERAAGRLSDDHLALFYFDPGRLFEIAEASGDLTSEDLANIRSLTGEDGGEPAAAIIAVTSEGAFFEAAAPLSEALRDQLGNLTDPGLLPALPGDSWLALGAGDLGASINRFLDQLGSAGIPGFDLETLRRQFSAETGLDFQADLLDWMGDAGVFVEGTGLLTIGGGAVIETLDANRSRETVDALGRLLLREGAPITPSVIEGHEGFAIEIPGSPQPINVLAGDEKVVIAFGATATSNAIDPDNSLSGTDAFQRATDSLGDGYNTSFFLDVDAVVSLAESLGAGSDETYQNDVKPWLDPLSHVVFGTKLDGEVSVQKFVIGAQ